MDDLHRVLREDRHDVRAVADQLPREFHGLHGGDAPGDAEDNCLSLEPLRLRGVNPFCGVHESSPVPTPTTLYLLASQGKEVIRVLPGDPRKCGASTAGARRR